ncbi:MAG: MFS transporter [Acidimicrobiia bacterium]
MSVTAKRMGMRTFFVVWGGQLVSVIGSGLTRFGVAFWVFGETNSVTSLAMVILAGSVPAILIGPFAGTFADHFDRRLIMIGADTLAGISSVALAVLWLTGNLELWHIIGASVVGAIGDTFQVPAYLTSVTLLVPKKQLSRANGLTNVNQALGLVLTPVLAGLLIATVGLASILIIDVATFVVAVVTLLVVRFPDPEASEAADEERSFIGETVEGLRYLTRRIGLLLFLFLAAILNFPPRIPQHPRVSAALSFTTEAVAGSVFSAAGIAMLLGSIVASSWVGPKQRMRFMLASMAVGGMCVALSGFRASAIWIAAWTMGLMALVPVISATSQTLWQTKVAPDYQGRVFATRRVIATVATPIAYILAGPLADGFFEPLLADDGALAGSIGQVIGTGPGRGIGFMYVLMGLGLAVVSLAGFAIRPLRNVETDLPDVIADAPTPETLQDG